MRNYDFEFAVSTEDPLYSGLLPAEMACVLARCKALRYWHVLCERPGDSSPEDSWHFLQTIAKGLFDHDGGGESELEFYEGAVTFPGRRSHYYFSGDDSTASPWPTDSVVHAIFESDSDYVIIVRTLVMGSVSQNNTSIRGCEVPHCPSSSLLSNLLPTSICQNLDCCYSLTRPGKRADVDTHGLYCLWCDEDALTEAQGTANGVYCISIGINAFQDYPTILEAAVAKLHIYTQQRLGWMTNRRREVLAMLIGDKEAHLSVHERRELRSIVKWDPIWRTRFAMFSGRTGASSSSRDTLELPEVAFQAISESQKVAFGQAFEVSFERAFGFAFQVASEEPLVVSAGDSSQLPPILADEHMRQPPLPLVSHPLARPALGAGLSRAGALQVPAGCACVQLRVGPCKGVVFP